VGKGLDILSKRERQVLELVAEGKTNPQIGSQLGISPKTVARHRERIMSKLDLHTAAALVKFAIRTGLIDTR
jgi:RNA polymerase sigma factor (sigma-70 family)